MIFLNSIISILSILSIISAGETKIGGLTFFEYRVDDDNSAFEINRAYFTYEKNVSDNIDFKFQIDAGREKLPFTVDSTFTLRTNQTRLFSYIKNAKLSWKTDLGNFLFGMQGMNMFSIQEKNWGYRFIEKSPMDLYKYSSSADMGIGYSNKFGIFSSNILITNGSGYKKPESDTFKKVSANVYYGEKKLGISNDFNTGVVFSYEPTDKDPTRVFGLFGGLQINDFRIGGEYNTKTNRDDSTAILSVYGKYSASKPFEILGRIDSYDTEQIFITGINYKPESALSIASVIRYTVNANKVITTVYTLHFQFKI